MDARTADAMALCSPAARATAKVPACVMQLHCKARAPHHAGEDAIESAQASRGGGHVGAQLSHDGDQGGLGGGGNAMGSMAAVEKRGRPPNAGASLPHQAICPEGLEEVGNPPSCPPGA